jgi:hypothetical protein
LPFVFCKFATMKERLLTEEELWQLMVDTLNLISGDEKLLPKINVSNGFAEPYIELTKYGYEYVCKERGVEVFRDNPIDLNGLLYLVFSDVTWAMANDYAVENRNFEEDYRRTMFNKHVQLLAVLSTKWAQRKNNEYLEVLKSQRLGDGK